MLGLPFRLEAALHQELQDSTYTRTQYGARLGYALGTGDRIDVGLEVEHVVQPRGEVSNADLQNRSRTSATGATMSRRAAARG